MNENQVDILARCCRSIPNFKGKHRITRFIDHHITEEFGEKQVHLNLGFSLNLSLKQFLQKEIYLSGEWERPTLNKIAQQLSPGDTFFDIGANIGFMSFYASTLVGETGQVIAIEANPEVHQEFQKNIELNNSKNIRVFECAVGDKEGAISFYLDDGGNNGNSGVVETPNSSKKISVQMSTIDALIESNGLKRPKLIKIDVEGAEVSAFKGMEKLLSSSDRPNILCEVSEWSLEQIGSSTRELFELMSSYGYFTEIISPIKRDIYEKQRVCLEYDVYFYTDDTVTN